MQKPSRYYLILAGLVMTTIILLGASLRHQQEKVCTDVWISFEGDKRNLFIDSEEVKEIINSNHLIGEPLKKISLYKIEQKLRKNPFVKSAEVSLDNHGVIHIRLALRDVLARFYNKRGESFYLTKNGTKMPSSRNYSARTILISGEIEESLFPLDTLKSETCRALKPMLEYIAKNPVYAALISEIYLDEKGELTIYPELGNLSIEFGDLEDFQNKLANLVIFYRNVMPKVGWNYYQKISLKYKNQVVAKKKHNG
jgi:cell division protein FtsQ